MIIYRYILEKNDEIRYGKATGVHINLKVLGVGDGLTVRHVSLDDSDSLLTSRVRTRFRNTLATSNMPSRIHIIL